MAMNAPAASAHLDVGQSERFLSSSRRMLVRVMQTQINEIEKASRTDKESPFYLLRDTVNRHRLLPIPELHSVVKIESTILKGARRYFEERDFVEIVVPHMTKATGACENINHV
jgi:aspartyl/asparaginyl-tRNA synthetase